MTIDGKSESYDIKECTVYRKRYMSNDKAFL